MFQMSVDMLRLPDSSEEIMQDPNGTVDMLVAYGISRAEANKYSFTIAGNLWIHKLKELAKALRLARLNLRKFNLKQLRRSMTSGKLTVF